VLRAGGGVDAPALGGGRCLAAPAQDRCGRTYGAIGVLLPGPVEPCGAAGAARAAALADLAALFAGALAAALDRSEEDEYSRFFSLSLDHLCIAGFDGYFKLLNRRWTETLGYTLEELYARPYVEFVHPDDRPRTSAEQTALREGERTVTFSNRYRRKDGTWCHMQWTAAPSYERQRIYAVARDVTRETQIAEELERSRAAAEAASQAKSAFLAMMSHELRTPLNSVIGFASILLRDESGRLGAEELRYLDRIRKNGLDLLALINSILDLSRIEAGRLETEITAVDLSALAADVVDSLRPQVRDDVELLLEIPPGPVVFATDEGRLRQVLSNLVANGLKFTPSGAVTLRLVCVSSGSGAPDRPLAFEVEDTGPGVAPEHLDTIFEPFRQLEDGAARSHDGSGLGLAISRSFAQALGLAIEVESEVGRGSTFRVKLAR
jgi:PAS domain S-box-containing protein